MFTYTTVRRDPDGEFSVMTKGPQLFPRSGVRSHSVVHAIRLALIRNLKLLGPEFPDDPYEAALVIRERHRVYRRDAKVWLRLDAWQKAQGWDYILRNTPQNSHIGNLAPRFSSGGHVGKSYAMPLGFFKI